MMPLYQPPSAKREFTMKFISTPFLLLILYGGLFILFQSAVVQCRIDDEAALQKIFQLRKDDEWKTAWHTEKHVRCRHQLLDHMSWACQKDIYKTSKGKRDGPTIMDVFIGKTQANHMIKPWSGLARRKRESKSISHECCGSSGCTWEEYAEYCPEPRKYQGTRSRY